MKTRLESAYGVLHVVRFPNQLRINSYQLNKSIECANKSGQTIVRIPIQTRNCILVIVATRPVSRNPSNHLCMNRLFFDSSVVSTDPMYAEESKEKKIENELHASMWMRAFITTIFVHCFPDEIIRSILNILYWLCEGRSEIQHVQRTYVVCCFGSVSRKFDWIKYNSRQR